MRVLLFHPWGRFDPAFCGAAHTACALLEYCQQREWEVHCVMQEIPSWGYTASNTQEITSRFECVKSVRTVQLDCSPVASQSYGDEFCRLLYSAERMANTRDFRRIASEPWDGFFTTDVTAAPYVAALPQTVRKLLAVGDSYARRAATTSDAPPALRVAEERFTFARVESELYRLFDRVLFACGVDARNASRQGVNATHIPPLVEAIPVTASIGEHDLLICGGEHSGDLADLEWFYRHVYLPHLRTHGVRLAVAGPVASRWPIADLRVTKLATAENLYETARVVVAPLCESAGPCVPVMRAMSAGRAVVATPLAMRGLDVPDDSTAVIDVRRDPAGTAAVIRDLLAAPGWRRALGERAVAIAKRHTREVTFAVLDEAWATLVSSQAELARAA